MGAIEPIGLAFDSSGNLYVANQNDGNNGTIGKFDSAGNGTVFASDLNVPYFIAVQVPEPATWTLVVLGALAAVAIRQLRCRLP